MPIFEFACGQCGRNFEELMTFAEMAAGEARCPDCGSSKVARSLSSFATGQADGGGVPSGGGCGSSGFG